MCADVRGSRIHHLQVCGHILRHEHDEGDGVGGAPVSVRLLVDEEQVPRLVAVFEPLSHRLHLL